MTAFDKSVETWRRFTTEGFEDALAWHMRHGLVHSEPDMFLMCHEGHWDGAGYSRDGRTNAWFVYMACMVSRPMSDLWRVVPHPCEWVVWARRGGQTLRAVRWDKLNRRIR
jgi:hypothetical protein